MSGPVSFDAKTGELGLGDAAFGVLERRLRGPSEVGSADEEWSAFVASGAFSPDGAPHPALARSVEAIRHPTLCRLTLAYGGRALRGWLSHEAAALLVPSASGRQRLMTMPVSLVPEVLARTVDLSPRPVPTAAGASVPVDAVEGVRRRWQLWSDWTLDDGRTGGARIDVLDTEGGWRAVEPGPGGSLVARPTTPTEIWRAMVRLVMRRDVDSGSAWPAPAGQADSHP